MVRRLVVLFLFLSTVELAAQEINAVRFEGLMKTKESYLRQFVSSKASTELDSATLWEDQQRLTNLEVLSNVELRVLRVADGYEVVFSCTELHTLLPIFSFGGIKENFWIQTGVSEVNFGGKGNKLTTYYQYYDRSSLATHLTIDRIQQPFEFW